MYYLQLTDHFTTFLFHLSPICIGQSLFSYLLEKFNTFALSECIKYF